MPSTSALDAALVSKLSGDATLTTLAPGGVYWDMAPQGIATPFVVITQMSHGDAYSLRAQAYEEITYLVKAVDANTSGVSAQNAADRIHTLLQDATLTVPGYRSLLVQRSERVRYVELDDESDRRWQHRGGLYYKRLLFFKRRR